MKSLILIFVATIFIQQHAEGTNLEFNRGSHWMKRQESSNEISSEESFENVNMYTEAVKDFFREFFQRPKWRAGIALTAFPKDLANPFFTSKWNLTAKSVKEFEKKYNLWPKYEDVMKVREFALDPDNSMAWKGLIALTSTKAELVNPQYRAYWDLRKQIPYSVWFGDEEANFFHGPQFNEFLDVTNQKGNVEHGWPDHKYFNLLIHWLRSEVYNKMGD